MVVKRGGQLRGKETWCVYGEEVEVVNAFSGLRFTLATTGGWERDMAGLEAKVKRTVLATDRCTTRTPDVNIRMLQNIYGTVCEP
jgi:hypothetical protein